MQTSLFDNPSLLQQSSTKSYTISEEKITQPLTQILEEITPKPTTQTVKPKNNTQSIKQSLNQLFPEQQYDEKKSKKAKEILGKTANKLTDMQLHSATAEVQYLAESWMDNFEREIFGGLTLQE